MSVIAGVTDFTAHFLLEQAPVVVDVTTSACLPPHLVLPINPGLDAVNVNEADGARALAGTD